MRTTVLVLLYSVGAVALGSMAYYLSLYLGSPRRFAELKSDLREPDRFRAVLLVLAFLGLGYTIYRAVSGVLGWIPEELVGTMGALSAVYGSFALVNGLERVADERAALLDLVAERKKGIAFVRSMSNVLTCAPSESQEQAAKLGAALYDEVRSGAIELEYADTLRALAAFISRTRLSDTERQVSKLEIEESDTERQVNKPEIEESRSEPTTELILTADEQQRGGCIRKVCPMCGAYGRIQEIQPICKQCESLLGSLGFEKRERDNWALPDELRESLTPEKIREACLRWYGGNAARAERAARSLEAVEL